MRIRWVANAVVAVGCFLMLRVLYHLATGNIHPQTSLTPQSNWFHEIFSLAMNLSVPFHVISVGFILKRKWLAKPWDKIAWFAVVISGCWLGIALILKHSIV